MRKKGFTLIELLVVAIIVGVLTSIAMPQYRKAMDRSKTAEVMEMLPAIFEARERWRLLNGYTWEGGAVKDAEGATQTPTMSLLDIESVGQTPNGGGCSGNWQTKNFCYTFITGQGTGTNQACVSAKPRWGSSRGITGVTIYYRGDKFSCTDGETAGVCDLLNVADSTHRSGCI